MTANPSALDPAGPAAHAIADLTWILIAVCGVVFLLTLGAFFLALRRGTRRAVTVAPMARIPPGHDRSRHWGIGVAAVLTGAVLSALVGVSFATDRRLIKLQRPAATEISVIAHQWWWEIRYDDPVASKSFVTANELHLPLNEPVKLSLTSPDVIHSFWVPNIVDKRDVIPGRGNLLWITATKPGEWHGRCAEFCGLQHAHMDILAIVEPRADFDRWRAGQAEGAREPTSEAERR
ncbi:MAG TPA: cytochrome c oxidase subunit II, partial [Acetobacteraceae bacterium]|nr:cytochrome c oxidase subunit II [Acetobacteraceae bacterium]